MTFQPRRPKAQPITKRALAAINNFYSLAGGKGEVDIPAKRAKSRDLEHKEQMAVIQFWRYAHKEFGVPERMLFAIPNGSLRDVRVAVKLKAEGVRAGVSDLFLAVPVSGFSGAFIEMKSTEGRESDDQIEFGNEVRRFGYRQVTCFGATDAIQFIRDYLGDR